MIKVDLSVSPSFYGPKDSKRMPSLRHIVKGLSRKDLDVVAITSCQALTVGLDDRWAFYEGQLPYLLEHWKIRHNTEKGVVGFKSRKNDREIVLVHTQKIRAYEGKNPAYLLVAGVGEVVKPARDVNLTAEEVRNNKGLVLACDPDTASAPSLERCLQLHQSGLIDGVQISATNPTGYNRRMIQMLANEGIKAFPSSNGKHFRDAGTSYAEVEIDKYDLDLLAERIRRNDFNPVYGQMERWQVFKSRDLPVLLSGPGCLIGAITGGEEGKRKLNEYLRCLGVKK